MYDYIQPAYDPDYMKRKLRRKKVTARDSLTKEQRREKSEMIVRNILDSEFFKKAKTVSHRIRDMSIRCVSIKRRCVPMSQI